MEPKQLQLDHNAISNEPDDNDIASAIDRFFTDNNKVEVTLIRGADTLFAYRSDGAIYASFCKANGQTYAWEFDVPVIHFLTQVFQQFSLGKDPLTIDGTWKQLAVCPECKGFTLAKESVCELCGAISEEKWIDVLECPDCVSVWMPASELECMVCGAALIKEHKVEWAKPYPSNDPNTIVEQHQEATKSAIIRSREGIVYLIRAGSWYKIGKTVDPKSRYERLDIQLPWKSECIHEITTNNIDRLEKHWHYHFRDRRSNGEWFQLTQSDVEEFTSYTSVEFKSV